MTEYMAFRISHRASARLEFDGPVDCDALNKLIKLLELSKDTFPTEAELQAEDDRLSQLIQFLAWQLHIERRAEAARMAQVVKRRK